GQPAVAAELLLRSRDAAGRAEAVGPGHEGQLRRSTEDRVRACQGKRPGCAGQVGRLIPARAYATEVKETPALCRRFCLCDPVPGVRWQRAARGWTVACRAPVSVPSPPMPAGRA